MYTLYFIPGACSLATQVVLRELGQPFEIIDKLSLPDFEQINPVGTVPVLIDGEEAHREGAAIMLHLLNKHDNDLLPSDQVARANAIQDILFANATMHPAYGRLFFIAQTIEDVALKQAAFEAAAKAISKLWSVVDDQLGARDFLGGEKPGAADIMLTVYSRWGESFPVDIPLGPNAQRMVNAVLSLPSFQHSLEAEQAASQ